MLNWLKKKILWVLIATGVVGLAFAYTPPEVPVELPVLSIVQQIEGLPTNERALIKSTEIAKLNFVGTYTDLTYGIRVEIQSIIEIEGGIEIMARAWKGGKQLGFGKDGSVEIERFRIYNPPILVDDPNGNIVRTWVDDDGNTQIRKLREDPLKAIREDLAHTIKVVGKTNGNIVKGKIGNTVSTFRPVAGANSPVDGFVLRGGIDETIGTIRAGAGTNSGVSNAFATSIFLEASTTNDQFQQLNRSIYTFDTSAIDDGDSIDIVVLSLFILNRSDGLSGASSSNSVIVVIEATPDGTANLINTDYGQTGSTDFGRSVTQTNLTDEAFEDITLNSSGRANINKIGVDEFAIRYGWDFDNTITGLTWSSGGQQLIRTYMADEDGTTKDPKLVVTHSVAVTSTGFFQILYRWDKFFEYSIPVATLPKIMSVI